MKKTSALFVVCLALFVSVFFGACGSKYKNLDMYFVTDSDCIQLTLDDEYWTSKGIPEEGRTILYAKTVKVNIDGIKKKDIGNLDVKVIPSDLAVIREIEVIDNTLYFNVYASRPGTGEIEVTHLSSGESVSITLNVDKKAISATSKNKGIVLNLPDANIDKSENFYQYTIDPSKVLTYNPIDATDDVHWEIVANSLSSENTNFVKVGNFSEADEDAKVNNKIQISSKAKPCTFYITPTLKAEGYDEEIVLSGIQIPVSIIKVVDETKLNILTKNAIIDISEGVENIDEFKVVKSPIYLFTNSLSYGNAKLYLNTLDNVNFLESEDYMRFYSYQINTSSSQVDASLNNLDHCIDVFGIDYNENLQWIEIMFTPNNCVGDIKSFTIRQEIVLTEVADKIAVKIDNENVSTSITTDGNTTVDIDLLDYYEKYGNLGQKFNFSVYRTSTHSSLKNLRIKIDEKFYDENSTNVSYSGNVDKNKYLLQFKKGNNDLKFYYSNGYYYSEYFTASDNLYIKYIHNPTGNEAIDLSFIVSNVYAKEPFGENALQNTEKSLEININRKRGIKTMELFGGNIIGSSGAIDGNHEYNTNGTNSMYVLNDTITDSSILNIDANGKISIKENQIAYGIRIESIEGTTVISDSEIQDVSFKCSVFKDEKEVDYFDFALFVSKNHNGEFINNNEFSLSSIANNVVNTLLIVKKDDVLVVPNGEYVVKIFEPVGGFSATFTYSVVTNVEVNNADITPFNETDIAKYNKIYSPEEYQEYLFGDLSEEQQTALSSYLNKTYIVPTKQDINTTIRLGKLVGNEFVIDDSYIPYVSNIKVTATPVKLIYNELDQKYESQDVELENVKYLTNDRDNLIGDFKFDIKLQTSEYGTVYNGEKYFIKVTYNIYSKKYEKIGNFYVETGENEPAQIDFYFFIYVDLYETKFVNELGEDSSIINTYFLDDLGCYYQYKGINTLVLSLPNRYGKSQSLFDYVTNYSIEPTKDDKLDINYDYNEENHSLTFTMVKPSDELPSYRDRIIKAEITQFGVKRTIISTIHVHKVELTEKLVIRNPLNYLDASDSYYIYLKDGGEFTFDVEQVGTHTFDGITYVVCDVAGNISTYYEIKDNKLITKGEGNPITDLKVLIFSSDWVIRDLSSGINTYDFNDLSYYTFNVGGVDYSERVKIIDVKIRDGSESNPYLIANGSDFADIDKNPDKHYEIVNDINLNGKNILIKEDFSGNLTSYKDYRMLSSKPSDWASNYTNYYTYINGRFERIEGSIAPTFTYRRFYKLNQNVYTVYNIVFNENFNLFNRITSDGELSNISFRIGFNNANSNVGYIGLIATNYGTLTNIKVEYAGNLTINSFQNNSTPIYVGMLVAQNFGEIIYDNSSTAYSTGSISITDNTTQSVYIGGLVGENNGGTIKGIVLDSNIESTEYVIFYENQGSLFDGNITVTNTTNTNSTLGGVVGFNNNGTIKEVFTSGTLKGYNNVGGLVGKNVNTILELIATEETAYIVDCLSTTQISAQNNVGGITGVDENGSYYHVYYEVYNNNKPIDSDYAYAIKGNLNVGGLIGNATLTQLNYCYFHSFRWGYKFIDPDNSTEFTFDESEFYNQLPDIYATKYVGGLIGYGDSHNNSNHLLKDFKFAIHISNSVVDAFVKGDTNLTTAPSFVGGLIGYSLGYAISNTTYVQGAFIGNSKDLYYDMIVCLSEGAIVSEPDKSKTNYYHIVFGNEENASTDEYELTYIEASNIETSNVGDTYKQDNDINNGRYYIELNGQPLITQAPTEINLDSALNIYFDRGTNEFISSDKIEEGVALNDKILIYYYNLINNNQENYINDSASVNVINLDEIVIKNEIIILPTALKGARIRVTSSDENVIVISASGYIKIVGEGVSTLRFASIIDSTVYDEITVIVRAKPTDYNIYKNSSMNEELDNGLISIVKGESKFIYENYVGETYVNGTKYLYNTTNDVAVFANIDNKDGNISINGKTYNNYITDNSVSFEGKQPIIISVLEYSETEYMITMTSYVKFELGEEIYYVLVKERSFTVVTKRGITKINTNVTDAVMSVADSLNVDLSIVTDTDTGNSVNINVDVRDENGNIKEVFDIDGNKIEYDNLFTYNNESLQQFNIDASGVKDFVLKLNQNVRIEQDLFVTITFSAVNVKTEMYLTLIPQKITSIVANAYKQDASEWKSSSVIRPGEAGMFVIDVAPDTAYFEYLEITDNSSEEKISFIQWSEFSANKNGLKDNGQALQKVDTPSSDGFGIKLVKTDKKSFYVYSLLSKYAINNVAHEIVITAYSSSGYVLGTSTVNLEAMLYPTVILSYFNEQDVVEIIADSRDDLQNSSTDLASGIQAKIGVTTYNTDGNFDATNWVITVKDSQETYSDLSKNLSMQLSENGYWYLTYNKTLSLTQLNDLVNKLVGKTVTITATVKQVTKGFEEEGKATLTFNFKRFTLNGISAQTGRQTSDNRIGGIVNEETYLEFYFNNTHNKDISYYQNGEYFNKNYFVDFNENSDLINNILKEINNFNSSENVILKLVNNQTRDEINLTELLNGKTEYVYTINGDVDLFKITKNNNELTKFVAYSNSINNYRLEITIKYHYNAIGEVELGADNNNLYQSVTSVYELNFVTNSSPIKYYPIKNSEEFMNMVQGQYYILKNDITLKNYKMLDINLGGFDGNGHTITIESFDYNSLANIANGTIGYLGLFKQIYNGEIVENLIVEYTYKGNHYDLSYHYASDNTDYTQFHFGGISAINAGIITNCKVIGKVYLQTSKISPANFYLGGMVSNNMSTGYITNSTAELELSAGGTIGGVVNSNEGKIVSTNFLGSVKAYTTTNTSLSNEINAAMFVVTNLGEISMCYVAPKPSEEENEKYVEETGVINSGGSLGGFAYENSGSIYDCYLKDITFSSRGYMGGFVYSSTGTIERCYINSNDTLQGDRYVDIFVYDKTSGTYKDCYYILTENLKSTIDGIKCITEIDINKESFYNNFAFNSQGYNVWLMSSDGPTLSSAGANIHSKTITIKVENGVEKIDYSISGTKEIPFVIYDVASFTYWFGLNEDGVVYGYFRFVSDINFESLNEVIVTANKVFSGTIEGNNMILSNFSLFTSKDEQTDSIGLFKEIAHTRKTNYVNNLILKCTSVRASTASCVGVLAGIINGGNVYSVKIDNPSLVVLGKNAVGGLAGLIKGDYVVENISSNVSVNASYRQSVLSKVNIYNGTYNTGSSKNNISEVSYAGGIAGILEGYDYRINSNVLLNNYYAVKNSIVSGDVILIAETVGGAFGFVNERARVSNVTFEAGDNAYLKGVYYSGGLVGENRGIIDNSTVKANINNITLFDADLNGSLASCIGGISAVNYSGLIYNCKNFANVISMYMLATSGGITGRNVGGTINYCENTGVLYGFFVGNMSGSDYNYQVLTTAGNSSGSITASSISVINRLETYSNIEFDGKVVEYGYVVTLESLDNWYSIQKTNLQLINKSISSFYSYLNDTANEQPNSITFEYSRLLGAVTGITDKDLSYLGNISLVNKENNSTFIKVVKENGANIDSESFVSTDEGEEKYSQLQEGIKKNNISEYYYLVPVFNESAYNFYNLTTNGYKDTYARVLNAQ